eukprot:TRINITY_DN21169_c0_g1_i1.p1 TRINITY_DN21169_c0_g1~~TRINITY_DN21169_c0_g1_i1.p1  ORF type:complete len:273 (+),score=60.80 TRINITY_DN21169_c0_g1_i1:56-874(+)
MSSPGDDFVVVSKCATVDDFTGFGDLAMFDNGMGEDKFIGILSRDHKEEVNVFLKKQQYMFDVRKTFREGRGQIWKQFYTDLARQDVKLDNQDLNKSPQFEAGRKMTALVERVLLQRKKAQRSKSWSFIPAVSDFLGTTRNSTSPNRTISSTSLTPTIDPPCNEILDHVDCLALYCQQGTLGGAFELLNKQYAQFNFEVYVDQGVSRLSTEIYEACSDDGLPDIHVRISKDFRVFQTDLTNNAGMREIGAVNMQVDITLFSDQNIQLRLQGV